MLIDATLAGLVGGAANEALVIPCLNRDGDLLSDLVLPLFGSIAGAESVLRALDAELRPKVVMSEAPHGTAPALEGKDLANPMAMILAERASGAIHASVLDAIDRGLRTPDVGGHAGTSAFTDAVIAGLRAAGRSSSPPRAGANRASICR